jgi:tetratricopeptide (TPR) repeat protein
MEAGAVSSSSSESRLRIIGGVGASLGIVFLAFIIRYEYLSQIESIPLFSNLIADSFAYDQWGRTIAAGDWLGKGVFYQAPLYPYFLGLVYSFFGHGLWLVRVAQIILGALSCGLLYFAGKQFFSRPAGVAAALILCFYAPAIFYDGLIQKSVIDLFLVTLLLVVLGYSLRAPGALKWLAAGVIVGLLALARENALVWVPVLAIWICWYFTSFSAVRRLSWSAWFILGVLLIVVPVGIRNLKVGGEFVLTTAQMGPNFYIGNNPHATGTYAPLRSGRGDPQFEKLDAQELAEKALGHSLSATQVSNYWLRQGWDFIKTQPAQWFSLLGKKWLITWNVVEVEDSDDFYIYQQWSPLLKGIAILGNFGFLAPLAALGVLLSLGERRRVAILYILILTMATSVALFYVFGRYRFPLVPFLALFAGVGVIRVYEIVKTRRLGWLIGAAAAAILVWFVVHIPIIGVPGPTVAGYSNLARMFARSGKPDEAIANYQKALQIDPQNAVAHYNLGSLLGMRGNVEESKKHLEQAIRFDPYYAEAYSNLGNVYLMLGNTKEASSTYRRALELNPGFDDTRFNLGMALLRGKEFNSAAEQFQLLVKKNPDNAEAQFLLGNALAAGGKLDDAIEKFREVIRLKPEFEDAYVGLARSLATVGRADEAMKVYQKALALLKAKKHSGQNAGAGLSGSNTR